MKNSVVLPVPNRSSRFELLDDPDRVAQDLAHNLRDIRRLNALFGGTALAVRCVRDVLGSTSRASVLDVATGSADIPKALASWSRRRGTALEIAACDISPEVLHEARKHVQDTGIVLCQADARSLPWSDRSFDVVLCCLALHHFNSDEARDVLAEMWRIARIGVVVTDLYRSYAAYAGTWIATRLGATNRVTWHDGPLSVLRAYTPVELQDLAAGAGISGARVRRHLFFRQTLLATRTAPLHG